LTTVYFATTNDYKWEEATIVAAAFPDLRLRRLHIPVIEVNSLDLEEVGRHKVLDVFSSLQVPIFVEHGALNIEYLRGLPGPLSKPFWDTLGPAICETIPESERAAIARSVVAYCNGRRVTTFVGEVTGDVAGEARGKRTFQWDPIFVPEGHEVTFAEMTVQERATCSQAGLSYGEFFKSIA